MIAKVEKMNMRQEYYKEGQENKDMLKNHIEKLKEEMDDHICRLANVGRSILPES
jgi:hypothetical protein